jgi:hypothetical protein
VLFFLFDKLIAGFLAPVQPEPEPEQRQPTGTPSTTLPASPMVVVTSSRTATQLTTIMEKAALTNTRTECRRATLRMPTS